jgi:lipopolysaccharide biosynthesis glycosyltransferase
MNTVQPFPIYVGWDSREDIAYQVCRSSLLRHADIPLDIIPLKQDELRERGLYHRESDPLASTEFTYTRFLVPALTGYQGWALFCDCDFLWTADVAQLMALADDRYAMMCVHHDHNPPETLKMDGAIQTRYPRKNWSSMVLYNCAHPANAALTPDLVSEQSGAYLHRFQWLDDDLIGAVPETWNWLEGWSQKPDHGAPNVVHYTRGGPWFKNWQDVDYGDLWIAEEQSYRAATARPEPELV